MKFLKANRKASDETPRSAEAEGEVAIPLNRFKEKQVGNDQEMVQSERNSHSIAEGWEKSKKTLSYLYKETYSKPSEQLFPNRRPLSYLN